MRTTLSHSNLPSTAGAIASDGSECSYHFTKEHTSDAFRSMNNMRLCGDMCDVTLVVGDRCISAHKIVLAATSPYFHAMFTSKSIFFVYKNVLFLAHLVYQPKSLIQS